jgi:hypothetical protein
MRFILRWALQVRKTPRELLASVTSEDITEMMAFERMEPFGALADEFRLGTIAATIANVQRSKESDPIYKAEDFMPALRRAIHGDGDGRVVIGADLDPEALSNLIDAQVFGVVH